MPEPAAYFAKERTRCDATNENKACTHNDQYSNVGFGKTEAKVTANMTKIIQRAKVKWLQECHESHPSTSSPSISQQQNCWFSHQPSEQYPIFMSDSHAVIMEMTAALAPMHSPIRRICFILENKKEKKRPHWVLTDNAYDKPGLSSISSVFELRPKSSGYSTGPPRYTTGNISLSCMSKTSLPFKYWILNPVCWMMMIIILRFNTRSMRNLWLWSPHIVWKRYCECHRIQRRTMIT